MRFLILLGLLVPLVLFRLLPLALRLVGRALTLRRRPLLLLSSRLDLSLELSILLEDAVGEPVVGEVGVLFRVRLGLGKRVWWVLCAIRGTGWGTQRTA